MMLSNIANLGDAELRAYAKQLDDAAKEYQRLAAVRQSLASEYRRELKRRKRAKKDSHATS